MDNLLPVPQEVGFVDAGTQKAFGSCNGKQGLMNLIAQFIEVVWTCVRQSLFTACPYKFIRVEFRGIGRKFMDMDARVLTQEIFDQSAFMNGPAIPEQVNLPGKCAEEIPQERNHLHSRNVFREELEGQAETLSHRRYRNCRNGRNSIPPIAMAVDWRLPAHSPGSPHVGNDQETAFVEENQMRPTLPGVFLYVANLLVSTGQFLFRCVEWLDVLAFDSSIPTRSRSSRHGPGGRKHHSFGGSVRRSAAKSTFRCGNRRPWPPLKSAAADDFSLAASGRADGQGSVSGPIASSRLAERLASNGPRSLSRLSVSWRQHDTRGQPSRALPRLIVAFPVVEQCQKVSCSKP